MREFTGYKHGVNLGGWLSQSSYEKEHLERFICLLYTSDAADEQ